MTETEQHGAIGAALEAGGKVLGTLPGQFLALCLVNVLFVSGLLYFLAHQGEARERVIQTILAACLDARRQ
jgi:hypothetical protein